MEKTYRLELYLNTEAVYVIGILTVLLIAWMIFKVKRDADVRYWHVASQTNRLLFGPEDSLTTEERR